MDYPRSVFRRDVCRALSIADATAAALVGLPNNRESQQVNLSKLAKALKADPAWILDCIEGRDFAVTEQHARSILGGTGHAKARAHLKKGRRYSARDLGLFNPPVSPLAGHPSSNSPHLGGNSQED